MEGVHKTKKKKFFHPHPRNLQYKIIIKTNWEPENLKVMSLVFSQQLRKLLLEWKVGGGGGGGGGGA